MHALVLLALFLATTSTDLVASGQDLIKLAQDLPVQVDNLDRLVAAVNNCKPSSVEDVVKAYEEYVALYKLQGSLTTSFNTLAIEEAQARGETLESQYSKIAHILDEPRLVLVVQNIFKVMQSGDYQLDELATNNKVTHRIQSALDQMAC